MYTWEIMELQLLRRWNSLILIWCTLTFFCEHSWNRKKCVSDWDCFVGRFDFCWSTCDKTKGTCKTLLGITINFPSFRSCVPFPFRNIILHLSFHLMQVLYDRLHKTFKSNRRWRFDSHWWRVLWWQVFVVANWPDTLRSCLNCKYTYNGSNAWK